MSQGFSIRPISPFLADDQVDKYWPEHVGKLSDALAHTLDAKNQSLAIIGAGKMNDLSRPVAKLLSENPELVVDLLDYDNESLPIGKQRVIRENARSSHPQDRIADRIKLRSYEATGFEDSFGAILSRIAGTPLNSRSLEEALLEISKRVLSDCRSLIDDFHQESGPGPAYEVVVSDLVLSQIELAVLLSLLKAYLQHLEPTIRTQLQQATATDPWIFDRLPAIEKARRLLLNHHCNRMRALKADGGRVLLIVDRSAGFEVKIRRGSMPDSLPAWCSDHRTPSSNVVSIRFKTRDRPMEDTPSYRHRLGELGIVHDESAYLDWRWCPNPIPNSNATFDWGEVFDQEGETKISLNEFRVVEGILIP